MGLGGGLMTLVWMCFEDDVTCTHALEGWDVNVRF